MPELRSGLSRATLIVLALLTAGPGGADNTRAGAELAKAKVALSRGDGIAAEVALRQALQAGAPKNAIAAAMGEALLDQGKLEKARAWLGPADFAPPEALYGMRMLAQLETRQGNLIDAGKALDRALAINPKHADVWVDIAQLRYRGGEQLESVDAIDHAHAIDPGNVRALQFRGLLVRDQFGPSAALPWFEAALIRSPNDGALLGDYAATLGDLGQARKMLTVTRKMIEMEADKPRAYFLQAVLAAKAGNNSLARAMLNHIGDEMQGVPAALLLAGVLDLQAGNANLAVDALDRLVEIQPQNENAQLLLARALYAAGKQTQLVDRFAAMAASDAASPYLQTLVGRALEDMGRREAAAPLLDRASADRVAGLVPAFDGDGDEAAGHYLASPRNADYTAAQVRLLLGEGRIGEALSIAERLRSDRPGLAAAQALAGDAHYAAGQYGAALDRYGQSARVRFDDALLSRMVLTAAQAGQHNVAANLVSTYLASHPQNREAVRLAADYAASLGDWRRARALLEHLRDTGSQRDARLLADLAFAQLRSGDSAGAEQTAQAAWQIQRSNPAVAQSWAMALAARKQQGLLAVVLAQRASASAGAAR